MPEGDAELPDEGLPDEAPHDDDDPTPQDLLRLRQGGSGMNPIITLDVGPSEEDLAKRNQMRKRYETEPEVRDLADKIHQARMMPRPACDQCIQMAIERLERKA